MEYCIRWNIDTFVKGDTRAWLLQWWFGYTNVVDDTDIWRWYCQGKGRHLCLTEVLSGRHTGLIVAVMIRLYWCCRWHWYLEVILSREGSPFMSDGGAFRATHGLDCCSDDLFVLMLSMTFISGGDIVKGRVAIYVWRRCFPGNTRAWLLQWWFVCTDVVDNTDIWRWYCT